MKKRWKGFTLIELLVVIAIIAILAAILFPVFTEAKRRSQMVGCLNNLKQLGTAFRQYMDDNNGRTPRVGSRDFAPYTRYPNWCGAYYKKNPNDPQWCYPELGQIYPYTKTTDIFMCKVDRGRESDYITSAPVGKKPADYPLSYSMNYYLDTIAPETAGIKRLSKCFLLLHENRKNINDGIFEPKRPMTKYSRDCPDNIHYDGTNILYLDCHAQWTHQTVLIQECNDGLWGPPGSY